MPPCVLTYRIFSDTLYGFFSIYARSSYLPHQESNENYEYLPDMIYWLTTFKYNTPIYNALLNQPNFPVFFILYNINTTFYSLKRVQIFNDVVVVPNIGTEIAVC